MGTDYLTGTEQCPSHGIRERDNRQEWSDPEGYAADSGRDQGRESSRDCAPGNAARSPAGFPAVTAASA